jgi:hypothetical protein
MPRLSVLLHGSRSLAHVPSSFSLHFWCFRCFLNFANVRESSDISTCLIQLIFCKTVLMFVSERLAKKDFTEMNRWSTHNIRIFLQEKAAEATKQKEEKRKKPKPEEHEGMPQHCPPEKRRGDRNPECHEEQQKDVA